MDESVQRFRSHMQVVVSLLNVHAQHIDDASAGDFANKLRMRIQVIAAMLPTAPDPPATREKLVAALENVAGIVASIYDQGAARAFELAVGDLTLGHSAMMTTCQVFAEFLSNIYCRPDHATPPRRIVARLFAVPTGRICLTVQAHGLGPDEPAEPVDTLTAKILRQFAASLGGEARFEGGNICDASLVFPTLLGDSAPG